MSSSRPRSGLFVLMALSALVLAGLLLLQVRLYENFLVDDAFISFRYARNLLDGQGLRWNPGEPPVEGYSNLLWVLLTAALTRLGLDFTLAARVLGFGSLLVGVFALLFGLGRRPPWRGGSLVPGLIAALFLVFSGTNAVWVMGGLEQPLVVGLLSAGLLLAFRGLEQPLSAPQSSGRWVWAGLPFGLLCITRPDAPLFPGLLALTWFYLEIREPGAIGERLARARSLLARLSLLMLLPLLFFMGQLLHRLWWFGAWVPNTALVKIAQEGSRVEEGIFYVWMTFLYMGPLLALAGLALPAAFSGDPARRRRVVLLVTLLLGWCAYLVRVGGDIFPAHRQMGAAVLLLVALGAESLDWLFEKAPRMKLLWTLGGLVALLLFLRAQGRDPLIKQARYLDWRELAESTGPTLGQAFHPQKPLVAIDGAGSIPFYSDLPAIDMLGLNDAWLARHGRPVPGVHTIIGHNLAGPEYILGREPDLIVFCGAHGSLHDCFPGGKLIEESPLFQEGYLPVRFENPARPGSDVLVHVRIWSPTIGAVREQGRVLLPAFLFQGENVRNLILAPGRVETRLRGIASFGPLELQAGTWRITPVGDPVELDLRGRGDPPCTPDRGALLCVLDEPARVEIGLASSDQELGLFSLELTRETPSPQARDSL